MGNNNNLKEAKKNKNDEFYTQLEDINAEIVHYKQHFKGKTILMNCDDPTWSNFWKYFHMNFSAFGIKKLISTHYDKNEPTYKMEYTGGNDNDIEVGIKTPLEGNGDFRNQECIDILKEADIVVTNPPFSLFREYVAQLMEYNKKFIIWGNNNAIACKKIFPLIKDSKIWTGYMFNKTCIFRVGKGYKYDEKITAEINDGCYYAKVPAISVFTNLDIKKCHEWIETTYLYSKKDDLYPDLYPKYDNYDAINVDKVSEIPMDYDGVMGVPITFLGKYNPEQFEIVGLVNGKDDLVDINTTKDYALWHENKIGVGLTGECGKSINGNAVLRGKPSKGCYFTNDNDSTTVYSIYARIFIRKKV